MICPSDNHTSWKTLVRGCRMAYSKGSPLFDAMSRQRQRSPEATLPGWVGNPAEQSIITAAEPHSEPDQNPWWSGTWVVAVRRQTAVLVAAGVLLCVIGSGYMGWSMGINQERTKIAQIEQNADSLKELRAKAVNPELWVNLPNKTQFQPSQIVADRPVSPLSSSGDPRSNGHNYFILMSVKQSHRDEADRAAKYLKSNGVDAAVLPTKNRSVVLVVLQGFAPPLRPQQSKIDALRNKLKALGRSWKGTHKGSTDWYDLYLDKH